MTLTLIAALGTNRVIGAGNDMPWHRPDDLAFFKRTTLGGILIMGRRTYDSIGRPLPGRRTIVVTRDAAWHRDGVEVAHSLGEALALAGDARVFVAGGGQVYAQALPLADRLQLTLMDAAPDGDTFFPEWDAVQWRETEREPGDGLAWVTLERS